MGEGGSSKSGVEGTAGGREGGGESGMLRLASRASTSLSLALGALVFEGLNPLYEPHFGKRPFSLSVPQVGALLGVVCLVYTLTALPIGYLTDRLNGGVHPEGALRLLQLTGWLAVLLATALLWPAAGLGSDGRGTNGSHAEGVPAALAHVAMLLAPPTIGVAAAIIVIPSLPDLQRGLSADDERGRSQMCALWNGTYSAGSALGPLAATFLYARYGWPAIITAMGLTTAVAAGVLCFPALLAARVRYR